MLLKVSHYWEDMKQPAPLYVSIFISSLYFILTFPFDDISIAGMLLFSLLKLRNGFVFIALLLLLMRKLCGILIFPYVGAVG